MRCNITEPKLKRICQPLKRYTFQAPLIKEWVEQMSSGLVLNLFAGITKLNQTEVRVDLDPETNPDYCMDALEFCRLYGDTTKYDTVILDPPYAYRKSMEKYKGHIASPFKQLKDELCNVTKIGSKVITFGYHSNSMGRLRGFELTDVLLICHGGAQHDTIAIVEICVKDAKAIQQEIDELSLEL